jgi:hypothetical protein
MLIAVADVVMSLRTSNWEINYATGAIRTRISYGPFYTGPWEEAPTWTSRFAEKHSIPVDDQWHFLSRYGTLHFIIKERSCGNTPVSSRLRGLDLDAHGLSEEEALRFVTAFSRAVEEQREQLWEDLMRKL